MAKRAIGRELGRDVIRISSCREVLDVATVAVNWSALKPISHVATDTVKLRVDTNQREGAEPRVVEFHSEPTVGVVAHLTLNGESGCAVVDRFGAVVILDMARPALS